MRAALAFLAGPAEGWPRPRAVLTVVGRGRCPGSPTCASVARPDRGAAVGAAWSGATAAGYCAAGGRSASLRRLRSPPTPFGDRACCTSTASPTPPTGSSCTAPRPPRRLEIMRTPDVGAFGTTAVTFALLGRGRGSRPWPPSRSWWRDCGPPAERSWPCPRRCSRTPAVKGWPPASCRARHGAGRPSVCSFAAAFCVAVRVGRRSRPAGAPGHRRRRPPVGQAAAGRLHR